jgi:DHA2 family multidrug resistance protein
MTAATGLYNVVRTVCGSIGIAVAATQMTTGTHHYHDLLAEHVTIYAEGTRTVLQRLTGAMVQAGTDPATAGRRALGILNLRVTRQANVLAYNHLFQLTTVLFLAALPLAFLLASRRGAQAAATKA